MARGQLCHHFFFYILFLLFLLSKIFHASTVEGVSFSVALTAAQEESLADAIRTDSLGIVPLLCQIDGSKATAQEASDLRMIQGAIARAGGMARLNASVMDMLRAWLRRALRRAQAQRAPEGVWEHDEEMIAYQSCVAVLLGALGHHSDALALRERIVGACRATLGEDHLGTVDSLANLAVRLSLTLFFSLALDIAYHGEAPFLLPSIFHADESSPPAASPMSASTPRRSRSTSKCWC